jgi:hypothetical protein
MLLMDSIREQYEKNRGDIEMVLRLVELDPSLLTIKIDDEKNLFLDLLEKGHIPTSRNQDSLTLAILDTIRYSDSYSEHQETIRDILNPSPEIIEGLVLSKLDLHLNILLLHTKPEITSRIFPRIMYLYPNQIFSFEDFSVKQLDEETIKNIRITLGSNPELDKYAEIFFEGQDVQMSEIPNRSITKQIEDLYLKYGEGSYIPGPNRFDKKSIGIHEPKIFFSEDEREILLRYPDPWLIIQNLYKSMRDDEVLFIRKRTLVYENQDNVVSWEILDANEIPDECREEPYKYNVVYSDTEISTEVHGEKHDLVYCWSLSYKNQTYCKRARQMINNLMKEHKEKCRCDRLEQYHEEHDEISDSDLENHQELTVGNRFFIRPDDKNDFGTTVRFALESVDIEYLKFCMEDYLFFQEFVIRYAIAWNGEPVPKTLILQIRGIGLDFLISGSIQFERVGPFLKRILKEDCNFNPEWYEYISEIDPGSAYKCKRQELLHLPPILRKAIGDNDDFEYDGDLSWLSENPTLLTVKRCLIEYDEEWSNMDHFLKKLPYYASVYKDYYTLGFMLMSEKFDHRSISVDIDKFYYYKIENDGDLRDCFAMKDEEQKESFCDGLLASGKSGEEIVAYLKKLWRY